MKGIIIFIFCFTSFLLPIKKNNCLIAQIDSTKSDSLFLDSRLNVIEKIDNPIITKSRKIFKSISQVKDSVSGNIIYYGVASFYSANLEGTNTSTKEKFKHSKLTCASNRFKLQTWLRVTNISNGKSVIVRVNDRMHQRMDAKGRIVDLTYNAAKQLNFVSKGITNVKVEVVPKGTKN